MFGRVALAHDYLSQRGGAERVALELAEMWPRAPFYTSLYRPESTFPEFRRVDVRASFLDRIPVDRGFRSLLPLYPAAFRSFGTVAADLLISSSSGWAHGLVAGARTRHVVYCHTPARWLYGASYMGASSLRLRVARPLFGPLRTWDQRAAARATLYLANSEVTRARIKSIYGRNSIVVPPPVDTERFRPRPRGERLLVVSRLLPYKRVDLAVDAATRSGIGLDVVGAGPSLEDLRRRAGPSVTFHGRLEDRAVTELIEGCRALCFPGEEDFGITPVEAQAAGKPVVAFAAGGALETIDDGFSGVLFARQDPEDLLAAVKACDALSTDPFAIALRARRFSRPAFRTRLVAALAHLAPS